MSVFFTLSDLCRKAKPSVVMWTMSSGICEHSTIAPMDASKSSRLTTIVDGSLSLWQLRQKRMPMPNLTLSIIGIASHRSMTARVKCSPFSTSCSSATGAGWHTITSLWTFKEENTMINNETIIYELCNKYQWFTCGSVRQYEKALTMAKGGVPITELARVIWICSDEVPYFDILTAISTSGYTENKNKEEQVDE
jgi:hypothetical protein